VILLVAIEVAVTQSSAGYESAAGSSRTATILEIRGLPPAATGPAQPSVVPRSQATRQVDPYLESRPSFPQADLGGIIDAPNLTRSFEGHSATGYIPPDPIIAAGSSYIVSCVNSEIVFYNKSGKQLRRTTAASFFAPAGTSNLFLFDPWVIYDEWTNRFMILFAAKNDAQKLNYNFLGISKGPSPLGGWWLYKHDMGKNGSTPSNLWGDYPKLATDRNAIYITANMANWPKGTFPQYSKIRVLQNKSQLINGTKVQLWWDFWNITVYGSTQLAHTIQPCHDYDSKGSADAAYFCSAVNGTGSNIYVFAVTNVTQRTPTGPSLYKTRVPVGTYRYPGNAQQRGGAERVENVAPRLMNAVKRNGSIWTTHSVADTATGCYVRWYEFPVNSWPTSGAVSKRQEGTFGGGNLWYYFPAIAVNAQNDVALVFNRSGTGEYVSVRWTGRSATHPLNSMMPSAELKAGEAYYVAKDSKGRNRWGDYSGCAAAPDGSIWFMGEYARPNHRWATRVGQIHGERVDYWVSSLKGSAGPGLLGFDGGTLMTSVTLPTLSSASVCMDHLNYRVLVFDHYRLYRYYLADQSLNPGYLAYSTLNTGGGRVRWGIVDEGNNIVYVTDNGRIIRAAGILGSNPVSVRFTYGTLYNAVAWNGDTGDYVAVTYGTTTATARIHFIARDGTLIRDRPGPTVATGIDYDPFTGDFYISRFGQTGHSLVRMKQSGAWAYHGPTNSSALYDANSVECREQPSPLLFGVENGNDPQHLWSAYPAPVNIATAFHTSSGLMLPSDLAINRQRVIWPTRAMSPGATLYLSVNFGPEYAGDLFQVATSLRCRPGLFIGGGHIHLDVSDPLVTASLLGLDGGAVWRNFSGVLNANGSASVVPSVVVPNIPALRGVRFFYAAVAYNTVEGIRAHSNMCGITVE
jgi:hypothetical protein